MKCPHCNKTVYKWKEAIHLDHRGWKKNFFFNESFVLCGHKGSELKLTRKIEEVTCQRCIKTHNNQMGLS